MDTTRKYNAGVRYNASRNYPKYDPEHQFRVLTWNDWSFWKEKGYLVVPNVVPLTACHDLIKVLWQYLEADPDDPNSWYDIPPSSSDLSTRKSIAGMVEIYHHPAMWAIRESKNIYDLFVDLWGDEKLWVTIDRANVNIPVRNDWDFPGFLHWDIDVTYRPMPNNIQGVLSLNNNSNNSGGLQIIPDLYIQLEEWLKKKPKGWNESADGRHHYSKYFREFDVLNLESNAGDLAIWDSRMVHGTSPNKSNYPRFAQYISMVPAEPGQDELLKIRLESFKNRRGPEGCGMPGDDRELTFDLPAKLTEHGKRLLGEMLWS